jgi:hypothetical protein
MEQDKETTADLARRVDEHMRLHYGVSLDDLEMSDVPGYWKDKEPRMHPNHPLHSCIGCNGPFRATYTFHDTGRTNGRFASRTRTWAVLKRRVSALSPEHNQENRT